jgi:hypothetical protein
VRKGKNRTNRAKASIFFSFFHMEQLKKLILHLNRKIKTPKKLNYKIKKKEKKKGKKKKKMEKKRRKKL